MICRVCDSKELELAIDLGLQPWANHFLTPEQVGHEPFYPLRVLYCQKCATSQLDHTVPKEVMFGNHTYLSGITKSLAAHFRSIAEETNTRFLAHKTRKSVLDIGSNDGTQLKQYQALGYDVLGVESSKATAQIANDAGLSTLNAFFNRDVAKQLNRKFDVINASGVFFHLEELHSVTEGIRDVLSDDGVFVVQFLYMKRILENGAFDQIYHEHLLYYNLETIGVLLNRHGLKMFDAYISPIHGGSVIGFCTHKNKREVSLRLRGLIDAESSSKSNHLSTYKQFASRIERMKSENLSFLSRRKQQGKRIFGFGAPVKGNTLLNYFQVGREFIDCLVEKNSLRKGLYSPGMHIPISMESEITPPDVYYVLAWNFKAEILANNQELMKQGVEFYFPVNPSEA